MAQTFSEEKPPKKPHEYGNVVICKKDFEDYKKFLIGKQERDLKDVILKRFRDLGVDNTFIEFHASYSGYLKDLIHKDKEKLAFTHFFATFPTCLPNRTRLRNIFESFKKS